MSHKCSGAGLSIPAQNVLDTLKRLAVQELICRKSLNTLNAKSGHCKDTVKKALKQLEQLGYIQIKQHLVNGRIYVVYHLLNDD